MTNNEFMASHNKLWSTKAVLARQRQEPVYLTNGCTESTMDDEVGRQVFVALGLRHGEFNGKFYPLTDDEVRYIGEDLVETSAGYAMTGYSALYQGRKYLLLSMEFAYQSEEWDDEFPTADAVRDEVNNLCRWLDHNVRGRGVIAWASYDDGPGKGDRHTVAILMPFELAAGQPDFETWKKYVANMLANYKPLGK
jgi:hypothetical protein